MRECIRPPKYIRTRLQVHKYSRLLYLSVKLEADEVCPMRIYIYYNCAMSWAYRGLRPSFTAVCSHTRGPVNKISYITVRHVQQRYSREDDSMPGAWGEGHEKDLLDGVRDEYKAAKSCGSRTKECFRSPQLSMRTDISGPLICRWVIKRAV